MTIKPSASFQIGKNGVTDSSIQAINHLLDYHKQVRITLLPSSGRNSKNIKEIGENIASKLARPVYVKTIGFTIILLRKGLGHDRKPKKLKQ